MTEVKDLIERIVEETGESEDEITSKMQQRKEKTHGLLSDYGAVYAVAKEYGIDLGSAETQVTALDQLKPSNSVNIVGRAKSVYSERKFKRKDGGTGKFASVVLVDERGESRLVLWDSNTEVVKKLRVGDVLLVKNGYVKENRGQIEVHAGALTNLTVNPSYVSFNLPEVAERIDSISALEAGLPSVNVICRVSNYYPAAEFTRSDGSKGSRASFIAEDETGTARVVLWDPLSESELKEGDIVRLENAYTREGLNGEVEIQGGSRSRVLKCDAKLKLKPLAETKKGETLKIEQIKPDMKGFTLESRVLRVYEPREYSKGMMASLIVGDGSATIRVVLWNEQSKVANEIKEGDCIRIRNAYSRANMNDEAEAHVGRYSQVTVDSSIKVPTASEISELMTQQKDIIDLDSQDRYVKISGRIVEVEDRPLYYMTCSECNKKVQNLGGEWMCEECGIVDGQPNMLASIVVEDDTGNIRAIAFRDTAESILGMDLEEVMNLIGETQDEKAPISHFRESLVGKQLTLMGRVNYNDYSDQLEFVINEAN